MSKKAVCVGINDYPFAGNDLNGCVNDAKAWADLLIKHFGFQASDVRTILDSEATRANILEALKNLLKGAQSGDVLVFTNSSHGTYVADKDGDEKLYDEAICPYDCSENLIIDDELRNLFAELPKSVSLSVISDSCFSGTVTRAIPEPKTPDDRRKRFLNPSVIGMKQLNEIYKAKPKGFTMYKESKMKDILLSGCTDREYSYDAQIGETYHGAMSYFAIKAIEDSNYRISYRKLHRKLLKLLDDAGFDQHPQLEGKFLNKRKQIFK
jgi:metacaspase-1